MSNSSNSLQTSTSVREATYAYFRGAFKADWVFAFHTAKPSFSIFFPWANRTAFLLAILSSKSLVSFHCSEGGETKRIANVSFNSYPWRVRCTEVLLPNWLTTNPLWIYAGALPCSGSQVRQYNQWNSPTGFENPNGTARVIYDSRYGVFRM